VLKLTPHQENANQTAMSYHTCEDVLLIKGQEIPSISKSLEITQPSILLLRI
jgi:hypothetical protein